MATVEEDFFKIGTSFRRPIAGESLARSPEDKYAWIPMYEEWDTSLRFSYPFTDRYKDVLD